MTQAQSVQVFLEAVRLGHISGVITYLDAEGDIEAKDAGGYAALHYAAMFGQPEVARLLIARGADVNSDSGFGYQALHLACINRHPEIASFLLDNGAQIDALSRVGEDTPLHSSATGGSPELIKLLLGRGAQIDARNSSGETPLMLGARRGNPEIISLLLEHGADVLAKDSSGTMALHYSTLLGNAETTMVLYKAMGLKLADRFEGKTLLQHFAGNPGEKAIIRAAQRAEKAEATAQAIAAEFDELTGGPGSGVAKPKTERGLVL